LTSEHTLEAWGSNKFGQLGLNLNEPRLKTYYPFPIPVSLPKEALEVVAGAEHVLARLQGNKVWGWGNAEDDDLLLPGTNCKSENANKGESVKCVKTPEAITSLGTVSALGAGLNDSFAVEGGSLYGWGSDKWGQLGIGSVQEEQKFPAPVSGRYGGLGAVKGVATSPDENSTTAVLLAEGVTAPPLTVSIAAGSEGLSAKLTVTWRFTFPGLKEGAGNYKVRACLGEAEEQGNCPELVETPAETTAQIREYEEGKKVHVITVPNLAHNTKYRISIKPVSGESPRDHSTFAWTE